MQSLADVQLSTCNMEHRAVSLQQLSFWQCLQTTKGCIWLTKNRHARKGKLMIYSIYGLCNTCSGAVHKCIIPGGNADVAETIWISSSSTFSESTAILSRRLINQEYADSFSIADRRRTKVLSLPDLFRIIMSLLFLSLFLANPNRSSISSLVMMPFEYKSSMADDKFRSIRWVCSRWNLDFRILFSVNANLAHTQWHTISYTLSGSYMWNKTEIKQICFRFVSDEIVLFQFYFSASYMWNKTLKQIESRRCFCRAHLSIGI